MGLRKWFKEINKLSDDIVANGKGICGKPINGQKSNRCGKPRGHGGKC